MAKRSYKSLTRTVIVKVFLVSTEKEGFVVVLWFDFRWTEKMKESVIVV